MSRSIRLMDAVPTPPASYELRIEEALRSAKRTASSDRVTLGTFGTNRIRLKRGAFAALLAAVLLLAATTAFAATVIARQQYTPVDYLRQTPSERADAENTVPEIEALIETAAPQTVNYSVTMLPELSDAETLNAYRQSVGQPAYDESVWGWIREIRPEVTEVLYADGVLSYNIRLHTPNAARFLPTADGPRLDAFSDETRLIANGAEWQLFGSGGIVDGTADADGVTVNVSFEQLPAALSESEIVTVTDTIGVYDCSVDSQGHVGLLANITCTFTFRPSAADATTETVTTLRPLFGTVTLTIERDDHTYENMPVQLDGVVLEETTEFRATGVYVTYRLHSAPDDWTTEMRDALLSPSYESNQLMGLSARFLSDWSDPNAEPMRVEHADGKRGEVTLILPIFPSDYTRIRETGCGIVLGLRCLDRLDGKSVGETWTGKPTDPENGWDTESREQILLSFRLPNPQA